MSNLNLNTLTFDTERRTGAADQAVLMPAGSVPVIVVFGDSLSAGAESNYADAQEFPQTRAYDKPYVGRQIGLHWNNWLETPDGINFSTTANNGSFAGGVGTQFEESVAASPGSAPRGSQPYMALGLINPVWGLLREIYGLFRDEVTGEVIVPRVVQVARTGSFISPGDASGQTPLFSWQKDYAGINFSGLKSGWDTLTDVMDAVNTNLAGTDSYLVGVFTTAGYGDSLSSNNTGGADPADNMAQYVGENLQKFREDLEAEYSLDQFPFVASTPRFVEGLNSLDTVDDSSTSLRAWEFAHDMSTTINLESLTSSPSAFSGDDRANPHTDGYGAYYLGTLWGTALRRMYSDPNEMVTGPQFTS